MIYDDNVFAGNHTFQYIVDSGGGFGMAVILGTLNFPVRTFGGLFAVILDTVTWSIVIGGSTLFWALSALLPPVPGVAPLKKIVNTAQLIPFSFDPPLHFPGADGMMYSLAKTRVRKR